MKLRHRTDRGSCVTAFSAQARTRQLTVADIICQVGRSLIWLTLRAWATMLAANDTTRQLLAGEVVQLAVVVVETSMPHITCHVHDLLRHRGDHLTWHAYAGVTTATQHRRMGGQSAYDRFCSATVLKLWAGFGRNVWGCFIV